MTRFARPVPASKPSSLAYTNAAKLCVYAPVAVIFLIVVGLVLAREQSVATALAWLRIIVLAAGSGAGIYALTGISKHGKEGILAKSVAGLIINGLLLGAVVTFLFAGPALPTGLVKRQMDASFMNDAGWVGMHRDGQMIALAYSIAPESTLAKLVSGDLTQPATIFVYGAQTGQNSFPSDCVLVSLTDARGKKYQPVQTDGLFAEGRGARWAAYLSMATAPTHDCLAFFPADVPVQQITSATVKVDGRTLELSGKYLLPAEKTRK